MEENIRFLHDLLYEPWGHVRREYFGLYFFNLGVDLLIYFFIIYVFFLMFFQRRRLKSEPLW